MALYRELDYHHEHAACIERVEAVQFSVLGPEEIRERSVVEVTTTETFIGNEPQIHGLFDPRMGVIEPNRVCRTCDQTYTFCPGHFGHIELVKPVFHVQFLKVVAKLLKCVCFRCSALLVSRLSPEVVHIQQKRVSRAKRWDLMFKLCSKVKKVKLCGTCGARQPDRVQANHLALLRGIVMEWKESSPSIPAGAGGTTAGTTIQLLYGAEDVHRVLRRITDVDAGTLGFHPKYSRPEWLICSVVLVPPPSVRPSVRTETGQRMEDDITSKLFDIIKWNNLLRSKVEKSATREQIDQVLQCLQYHVATLVDNQIQNMPQCYQRSGRPLRTLSERLKGKEGRIRSNLMGKRVDFSARSVISPDPNISIDEVGVPIKIATSLTFPEVVTTANLDRLSVFVRNGPQQYPGAKMVIKTREQRTVLLQVVDRTALELEPGDVVERHLLNGDYVLFNRQPSLHRMSMMGHRVRVMPGSTFRITTSVCPLFNSDFDGDEMNLHVPQSLTTAVELEELTSVKNQVITPKDSQPIIAVVQDAVLGIYRMTQPDQFVCGKAFCNMMASSSPLFAGRLPPPADRERGLWSGPQLLSAIIPPNISLRCANDRFRNLEASDDNFLRNFVVIEDGQVMQGVVDKTVYQSRTKGLIHTIFRTNGPDATRMFFDSTQRLTCDWLASSGFSVGVSDMLLDKRTLALVDTRIHQMKVTVYDDFIHQIHTDRFENKSVKTKHEFFEEQVLAVLNGITKDLEKLVTFTDQNRLLSMIRSKSKGQMLNAHQIVLCVGQQNIDGARISLGFHGRVLPHFTKFDDGPEARGFVQNSFIRGLTPQEFFFHSMAGREGLIDTAVKTSETGYIQRKLIKFMEDCRVHQDLTVRNAAGSIVQFLYGEDGMDATHIEEHVLPHIRMGLGDLHETFLLSRIDDLTGIIDDAVLRDLYSDPQWESRLYHHYEQLLEDRRWFIQDFRQAGSPVEGGAVVDKVQYPVSWARIIAHTKAHFKRLGAGDLGSGGYSAAPDHHHQVPCDLHPLHVLDAIDRLVDQCAIGPPFNPANRLFAFLTRCLLSPKVLIFKHRMGRFAFDHVVHVAGRQLREAVVHPGEMVGILAAQSIGEPSTQMTLNSFHTSGAKSIAMEAVRGVPRIRELMSTSPNQKMKSPFMSVVLLPSISGDQQQCLRVMHHIMTTLISDLLHRSEILFDPTDTGIQADAEGFMAMYHKFGSSPRSAQHNRPGSPWVLRLILDKSRMLDRYLTMEDIHDAVKAHYGDTVACMYSNDSAAQLVFRIRVIVDSSTTDALTELKALELHLVENVVIRGIAGLGKASLEEVKGLRYDDSTTSFREFKEWRIYVTGSNLMQVLGRPHVDARYTMSNDVNDALRVLGIEAARQLLYLEFSDLMKDASEVNYRHIALLVDCMTSRGCILPVDRNGMKRSDIGPLAKCSFEETPYILMDSGVFADVDRVNGVSANIMLGQIPPCGTGAFDLLVDMDAMLAQAPPPEPPAVSAQPPPQQEEETATGGVEDMSFDLLGDLGITLA
jgi:DNA-directed RNA polymerase II subunit RPB1